ncbi:MAG: winged helix-turn-helix domain-containing protein [Ilumatobacteraceae bacterium]
MTRYGLAVLGPTVVTVDGQVVGLRPRERDLLAALAVRHPHPVTIGELAELLWVSPPATESKTLQNHVARIRRALGPDAIRTVGGSYQLGDGWSLDTSDVMEACAAGQRSASVGDHHGARLQFARALGRVRGTPFADLESTVGVMTERERVGRLLDSAADGQILALLLTGDAAAARTAAGGLDPGTSERRGVLAATASYRAGHRLEALQIVHRCRQLLRERGLSPGDPLLQVEQALLADDSALLSGDPYAVAEPSLSGSVAPVLVGREREVHDMGRLLASQFDSSVARPPVVIVGPSGIGKSALLSRAALEARLGGWAVVQCAAPSAAAELLAAETSVIDRPLLVLADDCDAFSDADWQRLAGGAAGVMRLMSARRRPSVDGVEVWHLPPLGRASVQQLVELTLGTTAGDAAELLDAIVAGSGGVPGLVIELAIETGHDAAHSTVSHRLVRGLSEPARDLAALVAIATAPMMPAVAFAAAANAGLASGTVELAEALARRVLHQAADGRVDCRDETVRSALLDGRTPAWVRSVRHAWIAELDRHDDGVLAVADHLVALPDWPIADAVERHDRAYSWADGQGLHDVSLRNAQRARDLMIALHGPDHPLVMRREIDLTWFTGYAPDVFAELQWELVTRLTSLEDHTNLVRLVTLMARLRTSLEADPSPELVELIDRALALPSDPAVRAEAASAATDVFSLSDAQRCRQYAELSYEMAELADIDEMRLEAIDGLCVALGHPDEWPRRRELGQLAAGIAERTLSQRRRASVMQQTFSAQLQLADPLCRASLDRMELLGTRYQLKGMSFMHGYLQAALFHVENRLDECMDVLGQLGERMSIGATRLDAIVTSQEVPVRWAQGRLPELRERVDRLVDEQPGFGLWQGAQCWVAAAGDDLHRCEALLAALDDGEALPHTMAWAGAVYAVARAAARVGDTHRCETVHSLLRPHANLMAWFGDGVYGPIALALADLQFVLGRHDDVRASLATAQRLVDRLYAPVYQWEIDALAARLG